jgi:hypothetical protein
MGRGQRPSTESRNHAGLSQRDASHQVAGGTPVLATTLLPRGVGQQFTADDDLLDLRDALRDVDEDRFAAEPFGDQVAGESRRRRRAAATAAFLGERPPGQPQVADRRP